MNKCMFHFQPYDKYICNSYILQTEPKENVTLLDVTPSNSLPHPFSTPLRVNVVKFKVLVAKQHPTIMFAVYMLCVCSIIVVLFMQ